MTVRTDLGALQREVATRLEAAGVPSPEVDARWLVEHVVARFGDDLGGCNVAVLDGMVDRRVAREPLQRILGTTAFRWLDDVTVEPGVFVPRPETEVVAGEGIAAGIRSWQRHAVAAGAAWEQHRATATDSVIVVDLCTGSGVIAIALAHEIGRADVWATDVSALAVAAARANAAAAGANVTVLEGDLIESLPTSLRGRVDVLVSNPPYLPASDVDDWEPEVRDHDPHDALIGGEDGHEVVDRILALAHDWLRPGGEVIVEIDDRRGTDAVAVATRVGLVDARLIQDLTGRDRAIVASRGVTA